MKKFYTITTTLKAVNKDGSEDLLSVGTLEKAYKVRENAYKALQDFKKNYYLSNGYKPTRSDFSVYIERLTYTLYVDFEIKEHWLSDYEEKES